MYGAQRVAVKSLRRMNLASHTRAEFEHEFRMMIKLKHENIVNIIGQCPQRSEGELLTKYRPASGPIFPIPPIFVIFPYIFPNLPYMPYILGNFIRLVRKTSMKLTKLLTRSALRFPFKTRIPTETGKPGKWKWSWKSHRKVMEHEKLAKSYEIL